MKVIVLAVGLSKRLHPLTAKIPKYLIKIKEKSLLEYALRNFEKFGAKEVLNMPPPIIFIRSGVQGVY